MFILKNKLKKLKQEQILRFYNELNKDEKKILINDIKNTDIKLINKLYINSFNDEKYDLKFISPLPIINKNNNVELNLIGEKIVKNNQYAIVIMAGGNASRMGINKSKGCLKLNINNKQIYLFEIYINELKNIYNKYHIYINLYIMLNKNNYDDTIKFFEENNYFNYPKDNIKFFIQDELPIVDINGKILLQEKYKILTGPNGNGDVFKALYKYKLIKDMQLKNIKYVLFTTIDNILTKLVDFNAIGSLVKYNYNVLCKTIKKDDENNKEWVYLKYKNKPIMLPSYMINKNLTNTIIDNQYVYRERNITYHIIKLDSIINYINLPIPYHRSYKKYSYLDNNGNKIIPENNNAFKFEYYIFDIFRYEKNILLYSIDNSEFLPIKTIDDLNKAQNILSNLTKIN